MPYVNDMAILAFSISDNIAETPEGFLLCKNVKIARTGTQEYLGQEIGRKDLFNQVVKAYRLEEDVFAESALMSFEGKPVTYPHPPGGVTPDNASAYVRGHVQNIRQDGNFMIGDLVIMDAQLIQKIKDKEVREVSCGYTCEYVPHKDGFRQIKITGNHVAVVEKGRAGPRVAIKDSINPKGVKKPMNKKQKIAKALAVMAKDQSITEDELIEMAELLVADEAPEPTKKKSNGLATLFGLLAKDEESESKKETEDEDEDGKETKDALVAQIKKLQETVDALTAGKQPKKQTATSDWVDSVFSADGDEEETKTEDEDEEEGKKEAADAAVKSTLETLKPFIAKLPAKEQQLAKDAIRKQIGKSASGKNAYSAIVENAAKVAAQDASNQQKNIDWPKFGEDLAAETNPHLAGKKQLSADALLKKQA